MTEACNVKNQEAFHKISVGEVHFGYAADCRLGELQAVPGWPLLQLSTLWMGRLPILPSPSRDFQPHLAALLAQFSTEQSLVPYVLEKRIVIIMK